MIEQKIGWWRKFTSIVAFTLPFGNDGRGTEVKLFVIIWAVGSVSAILIYHNFFA